MTELPDLTSPRELKLYLGEKKLQPRRSMGQNFLIDRNIAAKIVEAAALRGGDPVVEIGPGAGALTAALAVSGMRVVAVELDRGLAAALAKMLLPWKNVSVLLEDALRVDWGALQRCYFAPGEAVTLLSNLPYNISTPFLYALYKQGFPFKKAILMFQKEVAQRLTAEPGRDYGALSVLSRYYTIPEILFSVSRSSFWPRPSGLCGGGAAAPPTRALRCGRTPALGNCPDRFSAAPQDDQQQPSPPGPGGRVDPDFAASRC